jgi:deoxycytidine triphosphate deaminase
MTNPEIEQTLSHIHSVQDILPGHLPGYIFPKLIALGHLRIEPFDPQSCTNICYFLHFNNRFMIPKSGREIINPLSKNSIDDAFFPYEEKDEHILPPGGSVIAQTFEKVGLSSWFLAKLENTSELGRILVNHASHGFLHPGHGIKQPFQLMIELTNLGNRSVRLQPAKFIDERIIGPEVFRLFIEKLPYEAPEYKEIAIVPKLRMDEKDTS